MNSPRRLAVAGAITLAALVSSARGNAACKGRPTDPAGFSNFTYAAAEVKSYATAQARVHYATTGLHSPTMTSTRGDGVPDTVAFAGDTAEDALKRYADMGFKKIPSDAACSSNGGDDKVDIYLVHFNGADGSTAAECMGSATTGCSSFALVEASFDGKGYKDAQEGFKTVVTHELFHAVQNVYQAPPDSFWAEGTAQWAMKVLHPELPDFERQMPAFFKEPTRSIDAAPSGTTAGFLYGSSVWPLFLSIKHGQEIVREILDVEATGKDALPATDEVLQKKGTSLAEMFPLFGAWNAATGTQKSAGGYPDAAKYPGMKLGKLVDGVTAITSGFSYYVYTSTLDAPSQIAFEGDVARVGGVVVPIEGGVAQLDKFKKLPANAEGEVLVVMSGITSKKTDAPFTVKFLPPGDPNTSSSSGTTSSSSGGGGGEDEGCHASSSSSTSNALTLVCAGAIVAALRSRSRRKPVRESRARES